MNGWQRKIHLELLVWPGMLLYFALIDPSSQGHFTFCVFSNLGWEICPGCGLGHAISYLLHGNLQASWQAHPLGIPAVVILLSRILTLLKNEYNLLKSYGKPKWQKSLK